MTAESHVALDRTTSSTAAANSAPLSGHSALTLGADQHGQRALSRLEREGYESPANMQ